MTWNPHNLEDNWKVTYMDGVALAGQPEGEGWNVTRNLLGFMDVYHQGDVPEDQLVQALHTAIKDVQGDSEKAVETHRLAATGLPNALNFTFVEGKGLKWGGRPDDSDFTVTEVVNTLAVWHYPGVSHEMLLMVLRLNIQFAFPQHLPVS